MDDLGFRYDNDLTRNGFPTTPQICTLYCALSGKDELYNFNTGFYLKENSNINFAPNNNIYKENNNNVGYFNNEKLENSIDFNTKHDINLLLRIEKDIFNAYHICIYRKWVYDQWYDYTEKDNITLVEFNNNGCRKREINSIIDILNKLACMI